MEPGKLAGDRRLHAAAVFLLAAAVFAVAVRGDFMYDDGDLIVNNSAVHGLTAANIVDVFTSVPNRIEYLPVRDVTYMLDYSILGLDPAGFRLSNVLYYAAACAVLYLLFAELLPLGLAEGRSSSFARNAAFVAAALFAVHPVHTEVAASASQRKDVLAALFLFLSLLVFVLYRMKGARPAYAASVLLFVLAMLSKSTAFVLPALVLLIDCTCFKRDGDPLLRKIVRATPFAVVATVLTAVNALVMRSSPIDLLALSPDGGGMLARLWAVSKAFGRYLTLATIPYPLTAYHPLVKPADIPFDAAALVPLLLGAALIALAYVRRRTSPCVSFAVFWFLVCILPAFVFAYTVSIIYERYLFLSSAGVCLLGGYALATLHDRGETFFKAAAATIFLALLAVFSVLSVRQSLLWRSAAPLYADAFEHNPGEPFVGITLSKEYLATGRYGAALDVMKKSRAACGPRPETNFFLALAHWKVGSNDDALAALDELKAFGSPDFVDVHYLYGEIYKTKGLAVQARFHYGRACLSRANVAVPYFSRSDAVRALALLGR